MRAFTLVRTEDVSGVSGTGIVAQGVQFDSGHCVMEWTTKVNSVCMYQSIDDLVAIHGHDGRTKVEWEADKPAYNVTQHIYISPKVDPVTLRRAVDRWCMEAIA